MSQMGQERPIWVVRAMSASLPFATALVTCRAVEVGRWPEVISPFDRSNGSTARTSSGPNMSAWRDTPDGQLSEMS
jgi:hypothetical protein